MYEKFCTRRFEEAKRIDEWLNSIRETVAPQGSVGIVGYAPHGAYIFITVRIRSAYLLGDIV